MLLFSCAKAPSRQRLVVSKAKKDVFGAGIRTYSLQSQYRLILCSPELEASQAAELNSDKRLLKDLKLKLKVRNNLKEQCVLVGLDGSVKYERKQIFTLKFLAEKINQMPMRKLELRQRSSQ